MAKITRIKASDSPRQKDEDAKVVTRKKVVVEDKKTTKEKRERRKTAEKQLDTKKDSKTHKKTFWLFRPFVALGRYIRDSWRELRQVRWPNRKTTWKMMFAVIIYSLLFFVIISLLDLLFSWLFNTFLNR